MKSIRALKQRIRSVSNTSQVTRTLYMVSASRMKQVQNLAERSQAYTDALQQIAGATQDLHAALQEQNLEDSSLQKYFRSPAPHGAKSLLVVIAPSRGFCGAMVSRQLVAIQKHLQQPAYRDGVYGIGLQKKAEYILNKFSQVESQALFADAIEDFNNAAIQTEFQLILNNYLQGMYSKVEVAYVKFISTFSYQPVIEPFLPLSTEQFTSQPESDDPQTVKSEVSTPLVEPTVPEFLKHLLERYLQNVFLHQVVQTKAAEHSARMVAMKGATDNAEALQENLKRDLNKARQESITGELLDIIGGMASA